MTSTARLAPLSTDDAEPAATLHARCFDRPWSKKDFWRFACAGGHCNLTAWRENELIGLLVARFVADEAEIITLCVATEFRLQGIAAALLQRFCKDLPAPEVRSVFLEVGDKNHAARKLYGNHGFRTVGKRRAYYETNEGRQDALIMRLDLVDDSR